MGNYSITTNILKNLETSSSIGMFARDTGGCLLSRVGLSRSKDETREVSFTELTESAIFYFSAPAVAKLGASIISKTIDVNKDIFSSNISTLKNLDSKILKKVKIGKFAQIASTFSLVLPLVYGIAPIRNLLTYSETGKNEFVSVVGLKKDKKTKHRKEAQNNAMCLVKKLVYTALGGLAATALAVGLMKNKKVYKSIEPLLNKFLKYMEFTKSGDLELAHYGALIYPVSIASYFAASRDKYEKLENARRFSITVPLMFFGEKLIQNPIYKKCDRIFKTHVIENRSIKSYKEIFKLPKEQQKQLLKSKNIAYGLTFVINTMVIAAAVAILNRVATKHKYQKERSLNS